MVTAPNSLRRLITGEYVARRGYCVRAATPHVRFY